jgi:hypothetical protein
MITLLVLNYSLFWFCLKSSFFNFVYRKIASIHTYNVKLDSLIFFVKYILIEYFELIDLIYLIKLGQSNFFYLQQNQIEL